jgi:hypothetical protein
VAAWQFVTGPRAPTGGYTEELTDATARSVTWRCAADASHEATCTIDGRSPQAGAFTELESDLGVFRDGQLLFGGRIMPTTDTLDEDSHAVTLTAYDYREVLRRRRIFATDTLTWTNVDTATIAWALIAATQAKAGGNLGIANGSSLTGNPLTVTFAAGDFTGAKISELGAASPGFEWEITAQHPGGLLFELAAPYLGTSRGVVVEYGGQLAAKITRNVDPSTFANALLVTGDSSVALTPQQPEDAGIGTSAAGRWDNVVGTEVKTASLLASRASWELANAEVVVPSYTVEMPAGSWGGPGHIWYGDTVQLVINSGRLAVNTTLRVMELSVALDEDGGETVTLTIGRPLLTPGQRIARMARDLRFLRTR